MTSGLQLRCMPEGSQWVKGLWGFPWGTDFHHFDLVGKVSPLVERPPMFESTDCNCGRPLSASASPNSNGCEKGLAWLSRTLGKMAIKTNLIVCFGHGHALQLAINAGQRCIASGWCVTSGSARVAQNAELGTSTGPPRGFSKEIGHGYCVSKRIIFMLHIELLDR